MKTNQILFWSSTGLLSAFILFSAAMYFFNYEVVRQAFINLSYPVYLIYPLAIAKIVAVAVLLIPKRIVMKEWAYAGLLFDFILAFFAHIMISDGNQMTAVFAIILLTISYVFYAKTFKS